MKRNTDKMDRRWTIAARLHFLREERRLSKERGRARMSMRYYDNRSARILSNPHLSK